jgi:hypothetical protein
MMVHALRIPDRPGEGRYADAYNRSMEAASHNNNGMPAAHVDDDLPTITDERLATGGTRRKQRAINARGVVLRERIVIANQRDAISCAQDIQSTPQRCHGHNFP